MSNKKAARKRWYTFSPSEIYLPFPDSNVFTSKTLHWEGRSLALIARFIQKHMSREGERKPKRQIKKSDIKWAWSEHIH